MEKLKGEDLKAFIKLKIKDYGERKEDMKKSVEYYNGNQDILKKQRLTIGEGGRPQVVSNLPNSRLLDNQFAKGVDQKVNYLFSKQMVVKSESEDYQSRLQELYDMRFQRTLNKIARESYLCGIAWLYIFNNNGRLDYEMINSLEITPVWSDANHEKLDAVIRCYSVSEFSEGREKIINKVAFYDVDGVKIFVQGEGGDLELISEEGYLSDDDINYSFDKIPFVYFKSNADELPILNRCKSLQDAINTIFSTFMDNMLEDPRNTIMVLKNYEGQDLGEFRKQLALYGAVKVASFDGGAQGGIDTIQVEVNSENYKSILSLLKEKLIENMRAFDCKSDKTTNAPNELNIKSMYTDIELDASGTELEFLASLEYFEYFFKAINGIDDGKVSDVKFKRNIMVNEESVIDMIVKSQGIISTDTILQHHPFVDDVEEEKERINDVLAEKVRSFREDRIFTE